MSFKSHIIPFICILVLYAAATSCSASGDKAASRPKVDVKEIIMGHVKDSYEWHFTNIKDKAIALYLPVIVRSGERGWFVFSSRQIAHGHSYQGFYLATEGLHQGKIVELNSEGSQVRPFDISITKNVLALWISCALLIWMVLGAARWYRHKGIEEAPKGFPGLVEMLVVSVYDGLIKPCIGKDCDRYAPYLLTAFFFIFFNNLMGLVPFFPGGANLTGNIAVTMTLGLATFVAVNVFGNKYYWKDILWPDVPIFLKIPPIMPIIELFGIFTKPFALMVRLFANIFAGHAIVLALTSLVFITAAMGPSINGSMSFVSVFFQVFMLCLELLVAYIQAYVFTMLSAVFIGLSRQTEEGEHHKKHEIITKK